MYALLACLTSPCAIASADEFEELERETVSADSDFPSAHSLAEELPPGSEELDNSEFLHPDAAAFGEWDPIVEEGRSIYDSGDRHKPLHGEALEKDIRPFDWMRHWGFHHSSTEGRFAPKNVPLNYSSWLNRPYHVDWFTGPLIMDGTVSDGVGQSNDILAGLRLGWDFDYYWGVEWRFGWADPDIFAAGSSDAIEGDYFVSDIDFIYYPWGDTKVRPFFQAGLGVTQIDNLRDGVSPHRATLLSTPFGLGVQFQQTPWLAWRLEIIDNLAWGGDGVDAMNNVAFTGGMEVRLGARPNSYWPWRSSRTIW
ncbi:MAG TPA: hypothetical protein VF175_16805 [Lacipirellula sp.]